MCPEGTVGGHAFGTRNLFPENFINAGNKFPVPKTKVATKN
jgi:hypothetical protein